jgi:hypothetical protein
MRRTVTDLVQAGEVVGGEDLALADGEVDFRLVEPGGVRGQVDQLRVRPGGGHSLGRGGAAVGGPVIDDPEHPVRTRVQLGGHHLGHQPGERGDPGGSSGPSGRPSQIPAYRSGTRAALVRLRARARERWPQIASLQIRHRGNFSYVDATLTDATTLKLCRLRYVGSASQWQFAIYRASHDDYDDSVFTTGLPVGTCQDALDTACGLYLNDPLPGSDSRRIYGRDH